MCSDNADDNVFLLLSSVFPLCHPIPSSKRAHVADDEMRKDTPLLMATLLGTLHFLDGSNTLIDHF